MFGKGQSVNLRAPTLVVLSAMLMMTAYEAQAVTETVIYNFCSLGGTCPDGNGPYTGLTSDGQGNFYGTTVAGGNYGFGMVYELSPNGSGGYNETTLYSFCSAPSCTDGLYPEGGVLLDGAGNIYGTTYEGGANGIGEVWELSLVGANWQSHARTHAPLWMWTETVLYSFVNNGVDGYYPVYNLIMDTQGNLYGLTYADYEFRGGSIFELSPSGGDWTEQVIYNFYDAGSPSGGLAMDTSGNLYAVANQNTLTEVSPNGSGGWNGKVIHNFVGGAKDGSIPMGTPVVDKSGNVYGTTYYGGKSSAGTVYKLTPVTSGKKKGTWTEKLLCSFKGGSKDGGYPEAGIVFDASGNMYGTTFGAGKYSVGTVFELVFSPSTGKYKEKVLWSFNVTDGAEPVAPVVLYNGDLYGTTVDGNAGYGDAFELTP